MLDLIIGIYDYIGENVKPLISSFFDFLFSFPSKIVDTFNVFFPFLPSVIVSFIYWSIIFVVASVIVRYLLKLVNIIFS